MGVPHFPGAAVQLRNGVDPSTGTHLGLSVLSDKRGNAVEGIFNAEFAPGSSSARVPLTRIDFSGYGASIFSRWRNSPDAIAKTSQVQFEVAVGRTAHEVVQVRGILYPWAVRVVRTVTIERTAGGGVFRRDSGWVPMSDGVFDFPIHPDGSVIETNPGVVKGVFNVRRIRDTTHLFERSFPDAGGDVTVRLAAVRFDADVRVADLMVGGVNGMVTSVDQVGFIQISPGSDDPRTPEQPLTPDQYAALLAAEGPLGGPVDCVIDIGGSGQSMRITRVDVAAAPNPGGMVEFAAAARGSLVLPNDGQWTFVRQPVDEGSDCLPADPHHGVPMVKRGRRMISDAENVEPYLFAEPADLLAAGSSGHNLALVWSTGIQRVLFARPQIARNDLAIRSVVAPLLADPFATAASPSVFPSALACLRIPFPDYSLEVLGEGRLRLSLASHTFAAERVAGISTRELSTSPSFRAFVDYANTRITLTLDSTASPSWTYEQAGVAIVQELNGAVAKTSHGKFRATSMETIQWTLLREEFGDVFARAKTLFPLLNQGITSSLGTPSDGSGLTVPLSTSEKPEGPNPKIGLRVAFEIEKNIPTFIGRTTGGHLEIITDFQRFFALEIIVEIRVAEFFPGGALLKLEFEALRRKALPKSETSVKAPGPKSGVTLAIGIAHSANYKALPFQFNWEIFIGSGFVAESQPGSASLALGIIFQASGSIQYPANPEPEAGIIDFALVEIGVNVEGQGLVTELEDGSTAIVCKGTRGHRRQLPLRPSAPAHSRSSLHPVAGFALGTSNRGYPVAAAPCRAARPRLQPLLRSSRPRYLSSGVAGSMLPSPAGPPTPPWYTHART